MGAPRLSRLARKETKTALLLLVPCFIGLAVFFAYPLVANVYYSFTDFNLLSTATWVGLDNYKFMFTGSS